MDNSITRRGQGAREHRVACHFFDHTGEEHLRTEMILTRDMAVVVQCRIQIYVKGGGYSLRVVLGNFDSTPNRSSSLHDPHSLLTPSLCFPTPLVAAIHTSRPARDPYVLPHHHHPDAILPPPRSVQHRPTTPPVHGVT